MDDGWLGAGWYRGDFLAAEREASCESAAVERRKMVDLAAEREISEKSGAVERRKIEWWAAERRKSEESAAKNGESDG